MREFWDTRYSHEEYVYGKEPNQFFKKELSKLATGRILLPAEGEGRNAVLAAKFGWKVDAFDYSEAAKNKAQLLANEFKVVINYSNSSFDDFELGNIHYDCIALIYVHMPKEKRRTVHRKLMKFLNPGGSIILEGFSKDQIDKTSGGPKNIDMLFSQQELKDDFEGLTINTLVEREVLLNEGEFHKGEASIIRLVATKPIQ